ncbi:MAG TPA: phosphoribosylanthranilate isomerase [Pirellulales bacterium]|jgi:phosphoribosylanthranilate isomerase
MFRIKICGITRPEDATAAIDAGADAIGLNFYRASSRFVEVGAAKKIMDVIRGRVLAVGVFVDAPPEEVHAITNELRLELVQLSGNETANQVSELKAQLGQTPIMQAVRVGPQGDHEVLAHLAACRDLGCLPQMILWDAYDATQFGGTGRVADWQSAARFAASGGFTPLVLAGGLRPDNVAEAIRTVRPQGVDTASGVEVRPGVKDFEKMRSFVAAARGAFDKQRVAD